MEASPRWHNGPLTPLLAPPLLKRMGAGQKLQLLITARLSGDRPPPGAIQEPTQSRLMQQKMLLSPSK